MSRRVHAIIAVVVACVAAASASPAGAAVSVGHSGWYWGNPQPQGNDLFDVDFVAGRGYAVGDFGMVATSADAGSTWHGLGSGVVTRVSHVDVIDANSVVVAGGCALRRSDNQGVTFSRLPWSASDTSCPSQIVEVQFPTSSVGYLLLEDGTLLRSDDGGQTWSRRSPLASTNAPNATSIAFLSADVGVATSNGGIYRTTDGGKNWTSVQAGAFADAVFPSPTRGWAVGSAGIYRSDDGGATWTAKGTFTGLQWTRVRCGDPDTCMVSGAGVQQRTSDGGDHFSPVTFPPNSSVAAFAFTSAAHAVAVGPGGATYLSDDGAATFARIGGVLQGSFTRLTATSASVAQAVGSGGSLVRTFDAGKTWSREDIPSSRAVIDTSFSDAQNGFALDQDGNLFGSSNGGSSWRSLDTGTSTPPARVLALDAQRVLLVGPKGLRRSGNGGQVFDPVTDSDVSKSTFTAADRAGAGALVYGPRSLAVSSDAGRSWSRVKLPSKAGISSADFVSSKHGFVLDRNGRLWETQNGGKKWAEVVSAGTEDGAAISFADARHGFIVIPAFGSEARGFVLRSSDGARSWRPQLVSPNPLNADGVAAGAPDVAYGLSRESDLFGTDTGGDLGTSSAITLKTAHTTLTRKALRKAHHKVTVHGKITPSKGAERVVVGSRGLRSGSWRHDKITALSDGTFSDTIRVTRSMVVVAQWRGDDERNGAGSRALVITVR